MENHLVIAIDIPLLDVAQKFHIKDAISLPVPYGDSDLIAEYELEFRNCGISTNGHQYVILTLEDQIKCGKLDINFCGMTSAIYETNQHKYSTLAIYQRNMGKIK